VKGNDRGLISGAGQVFARR